MHKSTILLPAQEHISTAYIRAQFYCMHKSTILLPAQEHNSTACTRAQFYCLQKSTALPPTQEHNSTAYTKAQFYCLHKSTILLPTQEHNSTAYTRAQFYCLHKSTILLPTQEHNSTAYNSIKGEENYCLRRFIHGDNFSSSPKPPDRLRGPSSRLFNVYYGSFPGGGRCEGTEMWYQSPSHTFPERESKGTWLCLNYHWRQSMFL